MSDSLILELKKSKDPSTKASIFYSLARANYGSDQDLAIAYADSSIFFGNQAKDSKMKANALNIKAVAYLIKSDFENSMKLNLEALKIRESIQDTTGLIESHLNLGNILYRTGKSNEAVVRYKKALVYAQLSNNQRGLSLLFNNIGSYYRDRWKASGEALDLDSAKVYLAKSLEVKTALNDSRGLVNTLNQLSELAQAEKKYMIAERYLSRGLEISKGIDDPELRISLLTQLTGFHLEVGDKNKALNHALEAYEIAEKLESTYQISNAAGNLSEAYEAIGAFEKALTFNKKKLEAETVLNNETKQKIQEDLLIQYESEKKELENQRLLEEQRFLDLTLQRRNELLIGMVVISVGLIGIGLFQRKKNAELAKTQKELRELLSELRQKNAEIELQSQLLSETNTALKESNVTRERLLSVISHDVKTPLNSLTALLDFWDKKLLSEEELNDVIPKISKQTHTVHTLLENLLEWSQAQTNLGQVKFSDVNLDKLISESIQLVLPAAEEKKLKIINQIPDEVIIHTDRDRLSFIIRNLITNALKFTPSEGQILISYEAKGNGKIHISDDGIGMSPSKIDSLFSRKIGSSRGTEGEKGSGVGLLLCKEFAESLGANLQVVSEIGKGSTFTINLG
ncbi:tetratricopeptide repeat-containing sensor histidine kinase [Algoriphagus sp. AK58]|uniref:tetratricopeptide repeat-containing sensor histidine kinase n=1 Tax=Algoriphagus sp. AK58 TaxID=1406877 RepID=UPI00164EDBF4|nr:tetratricopeptide repeat-containing sensor histidine kinase [Algoriphagus sp. AK58]